jgi:hypothetical protein
VRFSQIYKGYSIVVERPESEDGYVIKIFDAAVKDPETPLIEAYAINGFVSRVFSSMDEAIVNVKIAERAIDNLTGS